MTKWKEVTEDRYDEMLCVLPPIYGPNGFLVGEPSDHVRCSVTNQIRPNYAAFIRHGDKYYEADQCLTVPEFKAVKLADVVQQ